MNPKLNGGAAAALLALWLVPGSALADGVETHDGFFLRMTLGLGFSTFEADDGPGDDLKFKGVGGNFELSIGGAVMENFILHAQLTGNTVSEPDVELGSMSGEAKDTSISSFGIGGGVTWYLMPLNLYFSGSLLASQVQLEVKLDGADDLKFETDFGIGLNFMVGKEWWVSDNWGLGVAGMLHGGFIKDEDGGAETEWSYGTFNLLFTATYN